MLVSKHQQEQPTFDFNRGKSPNKMQDWEEQAVLVTGTLTQHNLHPTFHSTATVVTLSFLKSFSTKKYPINPCTLLIFQIKLELSHLSSNNQHSSVGVANILHLRWLAHG